MGIRLDGPLGRPDVVIRAAARTSPLVMALFATLAVVLGCISTRAAGQCPPVRGLLG